MTRKEALISTLRTLRVRPGLSDEALGDLIEVAADKLTLMAGPHRDAAPAAFGDVSLGTADAQKKKIEHLARELAEAIEGMSKPTVLAFADVGLLRPQLMLVASDLKQISTAVNQAKIDPKATIERRGRIKKGPIEVIRRIVANAYYEITGNDPSGDGVFLALSREVIKQLDLDDKPSGFAKSAYQDFKARKKSGD